MNFNKQSLFYKLIVPIFIVLIGTSSATFVLIDKIISLIEKEHIRLLNDKHNYALRQIIDRAFTELATAHTLREYLPDLVEVKKQNVIQDITSYCKKHNIQVLITKIVNQAEQLQFSNIDLVAPEIIKKHIHKEGLILLDDIALQTLLVPAWDWHIVLTSKVHIITETQRYIRYILPLNVISASVFLLILWFIFKREIFSPLQNIITSITEGKDIKPQGISEIDVLVSTINSSLGDLQKKNIQLQNLHDSLIKLQQIDTTTRLMYETATTASMLFDTEASAVVIFDKQHNIRSMHFQSLELSESQIHTLIVDISTDIPVCRQPIFLNSQTEIAHIAKDIKSIQWLKNMFAHPVKLSNTTDTMVLYLFNLAAPFDPHNISLLRTFAADIAVLVNKNIYVNDLKKFQMVIETSFDSILITNSKAEITYVNTAFEKLTGYNKEEVLGKNPRILKSNHHDRAFYHELWQTLLKGQTWRGELVNKKKNGELFYEAATIFAITIEGQTSFVAIKRDITQEKRLYEQLIRAQKMEAIGTLAGGFAHDFNNILTSILGYAELILHTMPEDNKYYTHVKVISESAKKAGELTKRILSITRKEQLVMKPTQINDIVKEVVAIISHSLPKNIEIITELSPAIPPTLADPTQIHQVILNLCVNARDAMPEGGTLTITTSLGSALHHTELNAGQPQYITITVKDTGIGMPLEIQQKVFDPFFTTKEKGKGTGLGLYVVHSIVTKHNGYINIQSEPNKGTEFTVYLPLKTPTISHQSTLAETFTASGTALVIDDEEDVRNICKELLLTLGYDEVITAADALEGIQKYSELKDKIKFVILDMLMPQIDGAEAFKRLKALNPDVKVIISSGYTQDGYEGIERLLKAGAVGFIQKPYTLQTLMSTLKQI